MSKLPHAETILLDGPAGRLEALVETPRQDAPVSGAAVLCHPDPRQDGTMHNKVVHTLARAFVARGFLALRFNFRGVGKSEGSFAKGQGELEDALAMVRDAEKRAPGVPLWTAGFSFGGAIAIAAAAASGARGLISVAPAADRVKQLDALPDCPWLVIQGAADDVVPMDDTIAWLNALEPGPELQIFAETGHFFHGKLVKLRAAAEAFIESTLREAAS